MLLNAFKKEKEKKVIWNKINLKKFFMTIITNI